MKKTNYIYLLGASHSGSTLLTMLLNAHPSIATVGELAPGGIVDPDRYLCSCKAPIGACAFWKKIHEQARSRGVRHEFNNFATRYWLPESVVGSKLLQPLHRGRFCEFLRDAGLSLFTPWAARVKEINRANTELVRVIMDHYGAEAFVDKGNVALRLKYLLRIPGYEIRTIHIVRDGRAVSLTYTNASKFADAADPVLRGGGSGTETPERKLRIDMAAYQWRRCNEEIENALKAVGPQPKLQVSYEELCDNTRETLDRIFRFIGVVPSLAASDFRSVEHHIVGNGMRLDRESAIRVDERWESVLTKNDLAAFDRVAGVLNRRYGYK